MAKNTKNYLGRDFKKVRSKDKLSSERRSVLMSKIHSQDTNFEVAFITALRKKLKTKFKTHERTIKGTPDIVFSKQKVCVFLDSDFWHGWHYPRWKHLLKDDFWRRKIEKNRQRDTQTNRHLRLQGWTVIRIWEHKIKVNVDATITNIKNALKQSQ